MDYKIIDVKTERLSPWVNLVAKTVISPHHTEPQTYHSFELVDYVNVIGLTVDGLIPLVRQYRPAVEQYTLELPGGLREQNEDPEATAIRELFEETGYRAVSDIVSLGSFYPDPGRLENRIWGFFIPNISKDRAAGSGLEEGVDLVMKTKDELVTDTLNGKIKHACHAGLISLTLIKGLL